MSADVFEQIRSNLLEKRANLTEWLQASPAGERELRLGIAGEQAVHTHLAAIEQSLENAACGELGCCQVCHEVVDTRLLQMDYTSCICLEHFSEEEARSLEQELELAQTVQKSLLPQHGPDTPYLEAAAFSRPAQVIGGDYFDFFQFGDGSQGLAIADVAGHGISAALHMASVQALLRTLIPTSSRPEEVVNHIHRLLIHNIRFSNFVTIFLAKYDPASHLLHYANAGHNPPLLVGVDKGRFSLEWLRPTGAAVGLLEESLQMERSIPTHSGDFLVMYTDGVTEAMNTAGDQFGYQRLAETVSRGVKGSAGEMVQSICQELVDFSGLEPLADDATILVCRLMG